MRTIPVLKWKEEDQGKPVESNTIKMLTFLIDLKNISRDPIKGTDNLWIVGRIGTAFRASEKSGEIKLEEADYSFLKKIVEETVPASWGMHKDIPGAVKAFMDAKSDSEEEAG